MKTSSFPLVAISAITLFFGMGSALQADVIISWLTPLPGTNTVTYKQRLPDPFALTTYSGTEDNWIHLNGPFSTEHRNGGADGRIIMGGINAGGSDERHAFMRFNLSSMTGQFMSINSVTLRLFWHVTPTGTDTVQFFPVSAANAGWVEGNSLTGVDTIVAGESTWVNRNHPGTPWAGSNGASTPGVDYVNTVLASNTYGTSEVPGTAFDLVFTDPSIITSWMGGTNAGIYGRTIGQDDQAIFRSSEFAGYEPELIINYTPFSVLLPPPAVPEPSSFVLLSLGGIVTGLVAFRRRRQRFSAPNAA
ncbi:MAG: DNRLRE domain-containing protein [Planctomycetaceae bacterium]